MASIQLTAELRDRTTLALALNTGHNTHRPRSFVLLDHFIPLVSTKSSLANGAARAHQLKTAHCETAGTCASKAAPHVSHGELVQ